MNENSNENEDVDVQDYIDSSIIADITLSSNVEGVTNSCVKMKLNTFCNDQRIVSHVNYIVRDINIVISEAYTFANFHVLRLISNSLSLPKIDRNFYYRCILAVTDSACRKANTLNDDFLQSIARFDSLRPSVQNRVCVSDYGQIIAETSIIMATMAKNHLITNIDSRLAKYLRWKYPHLKEYHVIILRAVLKEPQKKVEDMVQHITKREQANLNKHKKLSDDDEKFTRRIETLNEQERKRLQDQQNKVDKIEKDLANKQKEIENKTNRTTRAYKLAIEKMKFLECRIKTLHDSELKNIEDHTKKMDAAEKARERVRKQLDATASLKCRLETKKEMTVELIKMLRMKIPWTGKKIYASQAHLTLPLYYHILQEANAEVQNRTTTAYKKTQKRIDIFTLLPRKTQFTVSHIPISSRTFALILRALSLSNNCNVRTLDHRATRALWERFTNLKLVETKTRKFGNCIMTDGYSVSVLMNVTTNLTKSTISLNGCPSLEEMRVGIETGRYSRIVGVDPGFVDVITGCAVPLKEDYTIDWDRQNKIGYSSKQYYHRAKFNYSMYRIKKYNEATRDLIESLSDKGGMDGGALSSTDIIKMENWIRKYLVVLPTLLNDRQSRVRYRRHRFLRYVNRQKTIQEICDKIAPRTRKNTRQGHTLVGFGNWSGGHTSCISRKTCGPVKEIVRELSRRPNVSLKYIDEYNTSKVCNVDHSILKNMKAKTTKKLKSGEKIVTFGKVHRVLHCTNSVTDSRKNQTKTTWNRDVNASINILKLFVAELKGEDRPIVFTRSSSRRNT